MENIEETNTQEPEVPQRLVCTIYNQDMYDNRPLLNQQIKEEWLVALRSGEYKQGQYSLKEHNQYCCLGVILELQNELTVDYDGRFCNFQHSSSISDNSVMYNVLKGFGDFSGFRIDKKECLAALNDSGYTFNEIADIIETHF